MANPNNEHEDCVWILQSRYREASLCLCVPDSERAVRFEATSR